MFSHPIISANPFSFFRTYVIDTLLYDYYVEYDIYGIIQRLNYLSLISIVHLPITVHLYVLLTAKRLNNQGGIELTDYQINTLIKSLQELANKLSDQQRTLLVSSSLQTEALQAFLGIITIFFFRQYYTDLIFVL